MNPSTKIKPKVVIVGAGVIGAALAYRLQGMAEVTVVDAGTASATEASFGWINASFFLSEDHFHLRREGIATYGAWAKALSLPLISRGCLSWDFEGQALDAGEAQFRALGYPVARLSPKEVHALEPALNAPPQDCLRFEAEMAAEPGHLTQALMSAASVKGAKLIRGTRVISIEQGVVTSSGLIEADQIIVAAGTATAALLETMDFTLPTRRSPAYIVETVPQPPILSHVLATPEGEVRQRADGALVSPAAVSHQSDGTEDLTLSAEAAAEHTLQRMRRLFPGHSLDWASVTRAERPMPADGLPVIGRVTDDVYAATMHSGITLAAITAEHVAAELFDGPTNLTETQLGAFRPQRFGFG